MKTNIIRKLTKVAATLTVSTAILFGDAHSADTGESNVQPGVDPTLSTEVADQGAICTAEELGVQQTDEYAVECEDGKGYVIDYVTGETVDVIELP